MRAMVADPRWAGLSPQARAQAVAARTVVTPDGGRWLFGAHARWYRQDPADGRWHLSAPPLDADLRAAAHVVQASVTPALQLVPQGPDFAYERGSTQGFVGPDVPPEVTERVRVLVASRRSARLEDFPLLTPPFTEIFASDVRSTVAAIWGALVWCAYAPAFDGNEVLLSMFGEFLAGALPGDEWVRWLRPVFLRDLAALYGERVRAGMPKAALRLAALMANTADAILADDRFRPRAAALIAMLEPALRRHDLDHEAARRGDEALRSAWLARCPAHLAAAVVSETSPGDHFRHCVYDMIEALGYLWSKRADPRAVAAALLAADVSALAPEAAPRLYPWLDPELRQMLHGALSDAGHPLRRCWPKDGELPPSLHPPDRAAAASLLGAAYATGLAWCRLAGVDVPDRGFVTASAVVHQLVHQRDDECPAIRSV